MPAPSIFISYRRDDSAGQAGRLFDRLVQQFDDDHVFRDVDDIAAGDDFVKAVQDKIASCEVLIVVIGERWLSIADAQGKPRLSHPNDLVRREVAGALTRGIRVVPVLVQDATMPSAASLPDDLKSLSQRNAVELRDTQFDRDVEHFLDSLASGGRGGVRRSRVAFGVALLLLLLIGGGVFAWYYQAGAADRARVLLAERREEFSPRAFLDAAKRGDDSSVGLFLAAGMKPDVTVDDEHPALVWAILADRPQMARALLDKGADPSEFVQTAIAREREEILGLLLDRQLAQSALDSGLQMATSMGRVDLMERLHARGADLHANGEQALFNAAGAESEPPLRWLLTQGAKLALAKKDDGWTPLHAAVSNSVSGADREPPPRLAIVKHLIEAGADLNQRTGQGRQTQATPLLTAIEHKRSRAALLLLEAGADARLGSLGPDSPGYTALMLAAEHGLLPLIGPLLAAGVPVEARGDKDGQSALGLAVKHGSGALAAALLDAGADVNGTLGEGITPLMLAASYNSETLTLLLLKRGAVVNAADKSGDTALIWAARRSDSERPAVARALLVAGADPRVRNEKGESAASIARTRIADDLVRLIEASAPAP